MRLKEFQGVVYRYYNNCARDLPWRKTRDPYRILVSEIMLQQTQVRRALQKYPLFVRKFPTPVSLAKAPLRQILALWQGLGYNRRALLLQRLAKKVVSEYGGKIPKQRDALERLPGIGAATSGAVRAFAFNKPEAFIETNIRSVFIQHFFKGRRNVCDSEILPYVEKSLDRKDPRKWYYALMDYGVYLKNTVPNPGRKSLHYKRQSPFKGSDRQIRGRILRELVAHRRISETGLYRMIEAKRDRVRGILELLQREGLVSKRGLFFSI